MKKKINKEIRLNKLYIYVITLFIYILFHINSYKYN